MKSDVERLAYKIDEASVASGLSRSTLYELIGDGSLKSFKSSGRRLIMVSDLKAFLETQRDAG